MAYGSGNPRWQHRHFKAVAATVARMAQRSGPTTLQQVIDAICALSLLTSGQRALVTAALEGLAKNDDVTMEDVVDTLARELSRTNTAFDRERFEDACMGEPSNWRDRVRSYEKA